MFFTCKRLVQLTAGAGLSIFLASTSFGAETGIRGFTSDETASQREWEEKFRSVPEPENLREYMRIGRQDRHCPIRP